VKIVEVYTSIQGEGPNVGEPTTFIRFGGCNLRCAGWGSGTLPDGTTVGGCDTTFAVYPEWRDTWSDEKLGELLERVPRRPTRICLTGGEPLIQKREEMGSLLKALLNRKHTIDLFTNGTKLLPDWALDKRVTVVMDWKLTGSGEGNRFNLDNLKRLSPKRDAIKFVCKDKADFYEAVALIEGHSVKSHAKVYFGIVWNSQYQPDVLIPSFTNAKLVELMLENVSGAKLSVQMHNHIWPANERGR